MSTAGPNLIQWLANGERGISSNTIVTHLTGINAMGQWGRRDHPHDPGDLSRCRLLLEQVPELRMPFVAHMATCSPVWAALTRAWDELCALMDEEAPHWRDGRGSAPKTYRRMSELIDGARVKEQA